MRDLAISFLRLGTTAFGGPAAHIAMMEEEFVRRRQWLTRDEFFDLVGLAGLLPGPSSTEVALFVGHRRAGGRGLLVGGVCFIAPAALLVTSIAWAYVRFGHLPAATGVLYGIKAVVLAVVAQALLAFGRTALKSPGLVALAVGAAAASFVALPPIAILGVAGVVSALVRAARRPNVDAVLPLVSGAASVGVVASTPVGLGKLFLIFLKIGAVVFGSGYVLLAFLREDLVERTRWLTDAQLVDAVAVGQLTPGPVFTTATFIGYLVAGGWGALVATVAIFLPAFVLVGLSGPLVRRIRRSPIAAAFLDGVNVASLALMAVVAVQLGRAAIVDIPTAAIAVVSAIVLVRWRVSSAWLIVAGGVLGAVVPR